jgi:hypothetical protein
MAPPVTDPMAATGRAGSADGVGEPSNGDFQPGQVAAMITLPWRHEAFDARFSSAAQPGPDPFNALG